MIISQHGQTADRSLAILDRFDRVAKQNECLTRTIPSRSPQPFASLQSGR